MKRASILSAVVALVALGAGAARAEVSGLSLGYDMARQEVLARIGVAQYTKVEAGAGFNIKSKGDDILDGRLTVDLQVALHAWKDLTGYWVAGVDMTDLNSVPGNHHLDVAAFTGYEPELLLWEHLALAGEFGIEVPFYHDFSVNTYGQPQTDLLAGLKLRVVF